MNSRSNNYGDIIDTEYPFKLKHIRMGTNDRRRNIQRVVNLHHERETPFYDFKIVEQYVAVLKENWPYLASRQ